jgi:Pyruvate/2-oxoacid:ferredoxin oxidoreductase delta subunit
MSLSEQTTLRIVLYEGDGAQSLETMSRHALMAALLDRGYAVTRVAGEGSVAPADRTALLVLGQFNGRKPPRAEDSKGQVPVRIEDITGLDPAGIAQTVESARAEANAVKHGEWKPWFPVIDYDRCTNCMQCLSFCLFGVYGVDERQKIQVQNNDNCKTNCPACSRVCPEAAIMFPKYRSGPINGDVVSDADLQREKMKVDISALLGGDIYSMLRERSEKAKSRFSKERDADKALKERQKCLVKLAQAGDIPPEVLMSLPSPDEIARRAEEAKSKAQAALQAAKEMV